MRNVNHITLLLCLIGLSSTIYYGADQHTSYFYFGDISDAEHTSWSDNDAAIFSAPNAILIVAKTSGYSFSENDPRTSTLANLTSKQDVNLPQTLYLRHAEYLSVSQSVRTLIYPFHTFL